jgi:hypothetical protein
MFEKPDEYLLKEGASSCSDILSEHPKSPPLSSTHECTLIDHLLDCPVDNLSILQTHTSSAIRGIIQTAEDS